MALGLEYLPGSVLVLAVSLLFSTLEEILLLLKLLLPLQLCLLLVSVVAYVSDLWIYFWI